MGLLQKIKSTLGLGGSRSHPRREHSGDVDVTVEHEPDATAEAAVKGTDDSQVGGGDGDESVAESEPAAPGGTSDESEGSAADASGEGVPVDELDGIGAAYADRLGEAGIETVADLAGADAAAVAADSDVAESRIERWIDQAKEY